MKLFVAIVLGVLASFALTILGEQIVFSYAKGLWLLFPEFPIVALAVGAGVGLIARDKAQVAAAFSLAPWAVWLVWSTNRNELAVSRLAITIGIIGACFALGIGAAVLAGGRVSHSAEKSSLNS